MILLFIGLLEQKGLSSNEKTDLNQFFPPEYKPTNLYCYMREDFTERRKELWRITGESSTSPIKNLENIWSIHNQSYKENLEDN